MMHRIPLLFAVALLGACASSPPAPAPLPEPDFGAAAAPPANGSIFSDSRRSMFWFEDQRARQVGDALTVILSERTQAQKSARTSTGKDNDFSLSVPLFGGEVPGVGVDTEIGSERAFDGSGDSSQSNSLNGELTVMVVEKLPNGYLRIAGEKQMRLNQGEEYLRLTGIVRPDDISPDNTVLSTRVAQARIDYSGQGPIAQANSMGWLARFFQSPLWPF